MTQRKREIVHNDFKKFYISNIFRNNILQLKLSRINNIPQKIYIYIYPTRKTCWITIYSNFQNWRASYKFNQYAILNKKKKKLNKNRIKKKKNIFTQSSNFSILLLKILKTIHSNFLKHDPKIKTINNPSKKKKIPRVIDLI